MVGRDIRLGRIPTVREQRVEGNRERCDCWLECHRKPNGDLALACFDQLSFQLATAPNDVLLRDGRRGPGKAPGDGYWQQCCLVRALAANEDGTCRILQRTRGCCGTLREVRGPQGRVCGFNGLDQKGFEVLLGLGRQACRAEPGAIRPGM